MKNINIMNKGSWANKGVSIFTSIALVMAVVSPIPAYAAEAEDVATQDEANAEEAVPLASATDVIVDDENPLAGHDHENCWVHWWIIAGMLVTAAYSLVAIIRRKNDSDELRNIEQETLGLDERNEAPTAPELKLNPQPVA